MTTPQDEQSAPHGPANPIEQILGLLTAVDPVEIAGKAIETSRRTTEALLSVLENFAGTLENLNRTTARVNALLDDVEEPLRRVMPQVGAAMSAMATLGDAATQLADISKRLSPLALIAENAGGLLGFRPSKPSSSAPTTDAGTE